MQTQMASPKGNTERRGKSRQRPISLVYVELASANGGMMRDLSEEGFAVRAMMPLRAGEKTPFHFALSETVRIEGEGEILWVAESGRVAGVRFTEVSPSAREQIREWLLHPETPPSREKVVEKTKPEPSPTLDELREEIQTVPPRPEKPPPSEEPLPAPPVETVVQPSEPAPVAKLAESPVLQEQAQATSPGEAAVLPPQESPLPAPTAPALPRLSLTPKRVEPASHPPHTAASSSQGAHMATETVSLSPPTAMPESEEESSESDRHVPDISTILIQPSGRTMRPSPQSPAALPASSWDQESERGAGWTEQVSLSKAIAVMVVFTLVVGLGVFHRDVGQGLIWLGEALGGVQQTQSQMPAISETGAAGAPVGPSSSQLDLSSKQPPSTASSTNAYDNAPGAAPFAGNSPASVGTVAKNPLPSVAPLSGISSSTGAGAETGQAEYLKAIQILQGTPSSGELSEAVRLLWASVEKGNASAELALADMYWHGRAVARNCEQTRILLTAAARKGSAEAQKRLQQFEQEGCE